MHDEWKSLSLPSASANTPTKRGNTSVKRALSDRLTPSEAIEAAGQMISGYPQAKDAPKSYIGAVADLLTRYPRAVALQCADRFDGVPRETKFLPTPAEIIAYCERKVRPLYEDAEREDRIAKQLAERERWLNPDRADEETTRRKAIADTWLKREDERAVALSKEKPRALTAEEKQALLDDARMAAGEINRGGIKLSTQTQALIHEQDVLREGSPLDVGADQ